MDSFQLCKRLMPISKANGCRVFYGKPATCSLLAVSQQVFAAFCFLVCHSRTEVGHLLASDVPGNTINKKMILQW